MMLCCWSFAAVAVVATVTTTYVTAGLSLLDGREESLMTAISVGKLHLSYDCTKFYCTKVTLEMDDMLLGENMPPKGDFTFRCVQMPAMLAEFRMYYSDDMGILGSKTHHALTDCWPVILGERIDNSAERKLCEAMPEEKNEYIVPIWLEHGSAAINKKKKVVLQFYSENLLRKKKIQHHEENNQYAAGSLLSVDSNNSSNSINSSNNNSSSNNINEITSNNNHNNEASIRVAVGDDHYDIEVVHSVEPVQYYGQVDGDGMKPPDQVLYSKFFANLRHGFFVELGAYNGIDLSNTYYFERYMGWRGVLFEPNAPDFKQLQKNRPNSVVFKMGICLEDNGVRTFRGSGALSSSENDVISRNSVFGEWKDEAKTVQCAPMGKMLGLLGVSHVHLLVVDVEGAELEVLESMNWHDIFVDVIMVEQLVIQGSTQSAIKCDQVRHLLESKGFGFVGTISQLGGAKVGELSDPNEVWVHRNSSCAHSVPFRH